MARQALQPHVQPRVDLLADVADGPGDGALAVAVLRGLQHRDVAPGVADRSDLVHRDGAVGRKIAQPPRLVLGPEVGDASVFVQPGPDEVVGVQEGGDVGDRELPRDRDDRGGHAALAQQAEGLRRAWRELEVAEVGAQRLGGASGVPAGHLGPRRGDRGLVGQALEGLILGEAAEPAGKREAHRVPAQERAVEVERDEAHLVADGTGGRRRGQGFSDERDLLRPDGNLIILWV